MEGTAVNVQSVQVEQEAFIRWLILTVLTSETPWTRIFSES